MLRKTSLCLTVRAVQAVLALVALATLAMIAAPPAWGDEPVDLDMVNKIRDEGFHRSQVMETLQYMTDQIGPRLTGSPGMKRANEWTLETMQEWGLEGHLDPFEFGRGWDFTYAAVHMISPRETPLLGLPAAWTPGTKGKVKGEVMRIKVNEVEDLKEYEGKLKGKIVIVERDEDDRFRNFGRDRGERSRLMTEEDLAEAQQFNIPGDRSFNFRRFMNRRQELRNKLAEFLAEEKVVATLTESSRSAGILRVAGGGSREMDDPKGVPGLVLAEEHFNLIKRLLDEDQKVELEIEVKARFLEDDTNAYNTIAEIPGGDLKDQVVMAGSHLDSWHTGTGATDNGSSCAVVMEAVRILKALNVQPRRTIRVGLWSGEEQGLLGSRAYVEETFGKRQGEGRFAQGPVEPKPDHETFSVYFNIDNGGGRLRGVWGQENAAAAPIFEAWLKPFHDVGATTVSLNNTGGTDHLSFDGVGLPGFQFIQDPMDYSTMTHHTNLDVLDYVEEENLKQSAVVLASFLYHAAMRDDQFPRKPLPQPPPGWGERQREGEDDDHGE